MHIPLEIVEVILSKSDGGTLLNAKKVSEEWKSVVERLENKTKIWEWCCREDIPQNELLDYLKENRSNTDWKRLYRNWLAWSDDTDTSLVFSQVMCARKIPGITAVDIQGDIVALGSDDGRIYVYDHCNWFILFQWRHQIEKVLKLTYLTIDQNISMMISLYPNVLLVHNANERAEVKFRIAHVRNYSVFKNYLILEKQGGRISIERIIVSNALSSNQIDISVYTMWSTRVYGPSQIDAIDLWNGTCTILINNHVKQFINYINSTLTPNEPPTKYRISYNFNDNQCYSQLKSCRYELFRNEAIIAFYNDSRNDQFMEIFVLMQSKGKCAKRLFKTADIFNGDVTCCTQFGNTVVFGTDQGFLYFYHVIDWLSFSIHTCRKCCVVGINPITNIVGRQIDDRRIFLVTSRFDIHKIIVDTVSL